MTDFPWGPHMSPADARRMLQGGPDIETAWTQRIVERGNDPQSIADPGARPAVELAELRTLAARERLQGRELVAERFFRLSNDLEQLVADGALSHADLKFLLSAAARGSVASRLEPALSDEDRRAMRKVRMGTYRERLVQLSMLSPDGIVFMLRRLREETVQLPDGTTGWYCRGARSDDCWAAGVATCLQVPIEEVPDPRLDERLAAGDPPEQINAEAWEAFTKWLAHRALRMRAHTRPPVEAPRWIGIVPYPGHFCDHTLVMTRGELLFDPVDRSHHDRPVRTFTAAEVTRGYTFETLDPRS